MTVKHLKADKLLFLAGITCFLAVGCVYCFARYRRYQRNEILRLQKECKIIKERLRLQGFKRVVRRHTMERMQTLSIPKRGDLVVPSTSSVADAQRDIVAVSIPMANDSKMDTPMSADTSTVKSIMISIDTSVKPSNDKPQDIKTPSDIMSMEKEGFCPTPVFVD